MAITGLVQPMVVRFSPDGRVFVAEKSGLIKVFDNLDDPTPSIYADLRTQVYDYWDRGLLGMALAPTFPADPSIYVLYTRDAVIGGAAPRWNDACPSPARPQHRRLRRLGAALAPERGAGTRPSLINDWCQQFPSHSVGQIQFGPDGALYASAGDGAAFNFTDYGQAGSPRNPCGDPPSGVGGNQVAPTAEGGSLRAQDLRTSGDPVGLDGTIIRVNPATGAALPTNPALRERRPERPADRGLRPPQPLPHDLPARDERALDRRRRLRQVRRDRPDHRPPGHGRERRLAVHRGPAPAAGLGAAAHERLREPVRGRAHRRARALLPLRARRQGRPGRDLPVGEHVALRPRVLPGRALPGRLRRRALLRRLLARLHLGHARGRERPAEPERRDHVRRAGDESGRARDRARRRPLLRGLRRRPGRGRREDAGDDPADRLLRRQPAAGRPDRRVGDERPGPAHRPVRRQGLLRPGRPPRSPMPGTSTATAPWTTRPRRRRSARTPPPATSP